MNLHVITGASRGLGAELAKKLVNMGDDVVNISNERPELSVANDFIFDLVDTDQIKGLLTLIFQNYDLNKYQMLSLTNNAGTISPIGFIPTLDGENVIRNIQLNLIAPVILTIEFLKLIKNFKGNIVITNISSGVAENPLVGWGPYSLTKAGLENFSKSLRLEFADSEKVYIYSVNPGVMDTGMQKKIRDTKSSSFPQVDKFKEFKDNGTLRDPKEVAEAILKLFAPTATRFDTFVHINDLLLNQKNKGEI